MSKGGFKECHTQVNQCTLASRRWWGGGGVALRSHSHPESLVSSQSFQKKNTGNKMTPWYYGSYILGFFSTLETVLAIFHARPHLIS